jgi:nucleoside-diphosphate-sugar epimerase
VDKAKRLLGWEAQIDLREGIAATVEWLRERELAAGRG